MAFVETFVHLYICLSVIVYCVKMTEAMIAEYLVMDSPNTVAFGG